MTVITSEILINILKGDYKNQESEYKKYYRKTEYSDEDEVFINNLTINGELKITEGIVIEDLVKIENTTFLNDFTLNNITFKKHFGLMSNTFNGRVNFYGKSFNSISIYRSNFKQSIYFGGGEFLSVRIGNNISESVDVFGGRFTQSLSIDGESIDRIHIANSDTFINVLGLNNNLKNTDVFLHNFKLNRLHLAGQYEANNTVEIENIELHSINFDLLKNKGYIKFHNIIINQEELDISKTTILDFFEKHKVSKEEKVEIQGYTQRKIIDSDPLTELHLAVNDKYYKKKIADTFIKKKDSKKGFFEIKKIQLGQMHFKNFPLEKFEEIKIIDTELTSLKTFNSTFPVKKIQGNNKSLYEIFNDLYTVARNKNNKLEEIEYYKASQDSLLKSLLNNNWWKNIPSIISLSLSKLYSNFGTRWTQSAFLIIPILSFICFSSMLLSSNFDIEFSKEGFKIFRDNLVYYVQYLNPTHKITFMDNNIFDFKYSSDLSFVVFDFIGRILISIGIFETIKSFRKYVRR